MTPTDTIREIVERDRKRQGLPARITDPAALRQIAALVTPKAAVAAPAAASVKTRRRRGKAATK